MFRPWLRRAAPIVGETSASGIEPMMPPQPQEPCMNAFAKIALTLATVGSCVAASAQTYDSQADQDRRARNRDEAYAAWERQHNGGSDVAYSDRDTHHASVREKTHEEASKTRSFTHRQLNK